MDCMSLHIVLPVLHHREIKTVKAPPDVLEVLPIAAVPADVDAAMRRDDGKAAPLGVVACEEAPREVLRQQDVDVKIIGECDVRIPVLLMQVCKVESPLLKELTDTERTDISFTFGFSAITVA